METLSRAFNPDMLILGRHSRGLGQTELAEKVGVTQSRISKLEDGLSPSPPEDLIARISDGLGYPRHFFFQSGASRSACASFYRKKSTLPVGILNACDARMNIQRMHIERLVRVAEFETKNLPHLDPDEVEGGPEGIARQVRSFWNVPRGPIKNLIKIVEDAGCVVVLFDFGTNKLDGLSVFSNEGTPIIFLNKDFPQDRIRFTLAHELGHIIMHQIPTPNMEEDANAFAGEFLMPDSDIRASFYPVTIDQLARLKLRWHVSMAALLKRAETLGVITDKSAAYLWAQMSRYGYKRQEPHEDQIPIEKPSLLCELIALHFTELEYTPDELALCLSLNRDEFDKMYGRDPDKGLHLLA